MAKDPDIVTLSDDLKEGHKCPECGGELVLNSYPWSVFMVFLECKNNPHYHYRAANAIEQATGLTQYENDMVRHLWRYKELQPELNAELFKLLVKHEGLSSDEVDQFRTIIESDNKEVFAERLRGIGMNVYLAVSKYSSSIELKHYDPSTEFSEIWT